MGTDRLVLRNWRESDLAPFAALTADPEVMEHFPAVLAREESDRLAEHFSRGIQERGWGMWAVERRDTAAFVGYVGIQPVTFESWFTPAVEIAWRLAKTQWGQGLATEAAAASLDYAFGPLGLHEVVAFTVPANTRSLAVMRRLGMGFVGDFEHPRVPEGHRLRHHVLYAARPSPTG
ncbi:MAG: GNAT family N-acetyltransferase [Actinomycetota bacterium]|nr:GNAT family N-acetyltransferase [Actinomycetota bacterium]